MPKPFGGRAGRNTFYTAEIVPFMLTCMDQFSPISNVRCMGNRRVFLRAAIAAALVSIMDVGIVRAGDTGDTLDVSSMTLTFEDAFNDLSISAWGPGTRWISHTPWNGDFGGARFSDPSGDFPFAIQDGMLRITAARDSKGLWRSGLIASVDEHGNGFSQQYGYFEMRARLPDGPGVWPAFWLIGKDRSKATAEIDVIEYYGDKPGAYSSTVHVWHRDGRHDSAFSRVNVFATANPADLHTYGVKIDSDFIRMYFDGNLVWKTKIPPEHRQPMYMLIDLGIVDGISKMAAADPSFMFVDYVRAYQFK
ncbi:glycoside hydrolase family 16 protein [Rhizobium sp. CNPSo 4062]|uniref:glycoside hydrolase family 16 protein n=2 Tax=Rhizobium TaxID=379 RepID=UPI00254BF2DF|nr:glycoside hydrolase family 16 protein [Rhizobium sp. CNPSo 4062]MDK4705746.1 glycoside hydrolase family 16 protein [Rhizobium sp. CNPSo 4062]